MITSTKYSNFGLTRTIGSSVLNYVYYGTIDVQTTYLFFWKTLEKVHIFRYHYGIGWRFADSGKPCPIQVDDLAEAYFATTGKKC